MDGRLRRQSLREIDIHVGRKPRGIRIRRKNRAIRLLGGTHDGLGTAVPVRDDDGRTFLGAYLQSVEIDEIGIGVLDKGCLLVADEHDPVFFMKLENSEKLDARTIKLGNGNTAFEALQVSVEKLETEMVRQFKTSEHNITSDIQAYYIQKALFFLSRMKRAFLNVDTSLSPAPASDSVRYSFRNKRRFLRDALRRQDFLLCLRPPDRDR